MYEKEVSFFAVMHVLNACKAETPSLDNQLLVLEMAWRNRAQRIRSDALAIPGEFPKEQAEQVAQLEKMIAEVKADSPEMGMKRLNRDAELRRIIRNVRRDY